MGADFTIVSVQQQDHQWSNDWELDPETDCWVWQRAITTAGYGTVTLNSRTHYIHHLAFMEVSGPVPDGLELDHLCRNRACCNPAHLEAVTRTENTHRGARAKLTLAKARAIRASSESSRAVGRRFGVSHGTVLAVRHNRTWKEAA